MPTWEDYITAAFPRTVAATYDGGNFPRRALAGTLDAASMPGRAWMALADAQNDPAPPSVAQILADHSLKQKPTYLQSMAQIQMDPSLPLVERIGGNMFRDPTSILGPGLGEAVGAGAAKLGSGILGRILAGGADVASQTGLQAANQYGTSGSVDPRSLALTAGLMGAGSGIGAGVSSVAPKAHAAIMDNPAFQKWFGGSRVADKSGSPLTVYHGTDANFDEFKPDFAGSKTNDESGYVEWSKIGPNFTTSSKYASDHADGLGGGAVIPAHVKIENPYEMTGHDWGSVLADMEKGDLSASDFRRQLEEDGYDGILLYAKDNGVNSTHVIPFDPTQIKSATGNRGTFDPTDPNITHLVGGGTQLPAAQGGFAQALAGKYLRGMYLNQSQGDQQ